MRVYIFLLLIFKTATDQFLLSYINGEQIASIKTFSHNWLLKLENPINRSS